MSLTTSCDGVVCILYASWISHIILTKKKHHIFFLLSYEGMTKG